MSDRRALNQVVINVLAEQATLDKTSDQPGYLPGFGILPAESVRELAASRDDHAADNADWLRAGLPAHRRAGRVHPVARSDVSLPGL